MGRRLAPERALEALPTSAVSPGTVTSAMTIRSPRHVSHALPDLVVDDRERPVAQPGIHVVGPQGA